MNKDDLILIIIIPSPFYRLYRFAKWALSIPLMIAKPFLTVILIPITHFHRTFSFWPIGLRTGASTNFLRTGRSSPRSSPKIRFPEWKRNAPSSSSLWAAAKRRSDDPHDPYGSLDDHCLYVRKAFRSVRTLLSILIQCLLKSLLVPSNNS